MSERPDWAVVITPAAERDLRGVPPAGLDPNSARNHRAGSIDVKKLKGIADAGRLVDATRGWRMMEREANYRDDTRRRCVHCGAASRGTAMVQRVKKPAQVGRGTTPASERTRGRRLVNELPESELAAAERYLEYLRDMGDPLLRALANALVDNEPTTPEDEAAAAEGWEQYLRGEARPWEEVRNDLLR